MNISYNPILSKLWPSCVVMRQCCNKQNTQISYIQHCRNTYTRWSHWFHIQIIFSSWFYLIIITRLVEIFRLISRQLYYKETPTQVFSCEYWEILKNLHFKGHLWTTLSELYWFKVEEIIEKTETHRETIIGDAFRTQWNIYDVAFCKNSCLYLTVYYFCKTLHCYVFHRVMNMPW